MSRFCLRKAQDRFIRKSDSVEVASNGWDEKASSQIRVRCSRLRVRDGSLPNSNYALRLIWGYFQYLSSRFLLLIVNSRFSCLFPLRQNREKSYLEATGRKG